MQPEKLFENLKHLYYVWLQVAALCVCFLLELAIRLYVVPSVINLITEKTDIEKAAGVGREVGQFDPGPLRACPHYTRLHMRFRRQHTLVAVGNIAAMACTSLHLYYLAFYRQTCKTCSCRWHTEYCSISVATAKIWQSLGQSLIYS